MHKFNIGDVVKVVNNGRCYTSYKYMADKMGFTNYSSNPYLRLNTTGNVVAIEKHEDTDDILIGIDTGEHQFIVGYSGLEIVIAAPPTYQLTLSEEEKDVLICILESIGGAANSPRKFADNVYKQLAQYKTIITDQEYDDPVLLLVKYQDLLKDPDATLWFNDFPPEPEKQSVTMQVNIDTSSAKKDIEELTELLKQVEVIKNRIFKEVV